MEESLSSTSSRPLDEGQAVPYTRPRIGVLVEVVPSTAVPIIPSGVEGPNLSSL